VLNKSWCKKQTQCLLLKTYKSTLRVLLCYWYGQQTPSSNMRPSNGLVMTLSRSQQLSQISLQATRRKIYSKLLLKLRLRSDKRKERKRKLLMKKRKRITLMKKEKKVKRMEVETRMMKMKVQALQKSQRKRKRRSKRINKEINKR
jgi:hypothetical protein